MATVSINQGKLFQDSSSFKQIEVAPFPIMCPSTASINYCFANFISKIDKHMPIDAFKEKVSELESKGYTHTTGGYAGLTALASAAFNGNLPIVKYLLKTTGKTLLDIGDSCGRTPLFLAAQCKDMDAAYRVAKKLLSKGASVNMTTFKVKNSYTRLPIWAAAQTIYSSPLTTLFLLSGAILPKAEELDEAAKDVLAAALKRFQEEKKKRSLLGKIFREAFVQGEESSALPWLPQEIALKIARLYVKIF